MKKLILILLGAALLTGCSPKFKAEKHMRKAKAHIAKAESFGAKWHTDTVFQKVTVEIPKVQVDTVFKEGDPGDTVVVTKDRLTVKYVKLPGDSVYIQGECKDSIIVKEVPMVINNELVSPPDKWKRPFFILLGIIVLAVVSSLVLARYRVER